MTSPNVSNLSLEGARWHCQNDKDRIQSIIQTNHLPKLLAACLARLELNPGKEIDDFLNPCIEQLHDPYLMLNMDKAVKRFKQAIAQQEPIRVVTDYDVDGTMSSLILQAVLQLCGHRDFSYHIPDRKDEGYGFTTIAAQKAIDDHIKLIVTADIGVRDEAAISLAQSHGIEVIVLDHHLPEGCGVPQSAFAVLCPPQEGCGYPNKSLAACGISLKFAQALLEGHPRKPLYLRSLLKLAALGTIADIVSLMDPENRAITATGLDALNFDSHNPGLEALLSISRTPKGEITSSDVGFQIAPRINAAGRMASATLIIELLHARNRVEAQGLAAKLDAMNGDRKYIQEQMVQTAIDCIDTQFSNDIFPIVALPESIEWHSGVAGIVASRLKEKYNRPVAVATIIGQTVTGSIRSTPGVHAVTTLTDAADLLIKFGGHAAAAGFSCDISNLEAIRKRFAQSAAEQLKGIPETPLTEIAACLSPAELSIDDFDDLQRLEPCGCQNHQPLICLKNVRLENIGWMKNIHLAADIPCGPISTRFRLRLVWFNPPATIHDCLILPLDIVGELNKETWNGNLRYQMRIRDAVPSNTNVFI